MPICCKSRAFVENKYTTHHDYNMFNTKYGNKNIENITQKGNLIKLSVVPRRTNKKIIRAEILHLGKTTEETPNWKFSDNYLWNVLPMVRAELEPLLDEESCIEERSHLKSIARNILSNNKTKGSNTSDSNNIDAYVLSSLQPYGTNDDKSNEMTEIINITIGGKYTGKVNKSRYNKLACTYIYASGIKK